VDAITPAQLAIRLWGSAEVGSRSAGARQIRRVARSLFPGEAPGKGGPGLLTPTQIEAIKRQVGSNSPTTGEGE